MNNAWQEDGVGKPIVSKGWRQRVWELLLRRVLRSRVGCGDTGVAARLKQRNKQARITQPSRYPEGI